MGSPALDATKPGGERNTRKRAGDLSQNGYSKMQKQNDPPTLNFVASWAMSLRGEQKVAIPAAGDRTIYKTDLRNFDVLFRKLFGSVVGPPAGMDWTRPWHEILQAGNGHFISFQSLASMTHRHGTQALYWRCAKLLALCETIGAVRNKRIAPRFSTASSWKTRPHQGQHPRPQRLQVCTPWTPRSSLGVLGAAAVQQSGAEGFDQKTRTASPHQWRAELQSFQEALTGDKSGCLKFLGNEKTNEFAALHGIELWSQRCVQQQWHLTDLTHYISRLLADNLFPHVAEKIACYACK